MTAQQSTFDFSYPANSGVGGNSASNAPSNNAAQPQSPPPAAPPTPVTKPVQSNVVGNVSQIQAAPVVPSSPAPTSSPTPTPSPTPTYSPPSPTPTPSTPSPTPTPQSDGSLQNLLAKLKKIRKEEPPSQGSGNLKSKLSTPKLRQSGIQNPAKGADELESKDKVDAQKSPQSPAPGSQFPIPNPQSPTPKPQSPTPNSQSPILKPQFPIPNSQFPIPQPVSPVPQPIAKPVLPTKPAPQPVPKPVASVKPKPNPQFPIPNSQFPIPQPVKPAPQPAVKPVLPVKPVPQPIVKPVVKPAAPVQPVQPLGSQPKPSVRPQKDIDKVQKPSATDVKKSGKYPFTIHQLLDLVIERDASDLHISVGYPAMIRVDGELVPVSGDMVDETISEELILPILDEAKKDRLEVNREVDLAYAYGKKARFRINAFYQQQSIAAAFRLIPSTIRSIDELNLPPIYHQLTALNQGLVLVTGPTGSGKTTTLAAILQEVNQTRACHILTIEDPVEYVYPAAKALIAQRELGEDTHAWKIAMKSALREDPDVVLVGEMRDYETIASAITLAETGHLVFATLHTNSASQTIDRVIDVFPEHQQNQVRAQLSNIIEAVIAQRLVPLQGGGRVAVSEIMLANPAVRNLIREGKTHQLDNVIRTSADIGMISMEHSLVKLVRSGKITMETAQRFAVKPEEVVRLLKS